MTCRPTIPSRPALWFVASEAVANSLKHADAHEIQIHLRVDGSSAELTITDDGCGGAIGSPAAIARRLAAFDSTLEVTQSARRRHDDPRHGSRW